MPRLSIIEPQTETLSQYAAAQPLTLQDVSTQLAEIHGALENLMYEHRTDMTESVLTELSNIRIKIVPILQTAEMEQD